MWLTRSFVVHFTIKHYHYLPRETNAHISFIMTPVHKYASNKAKVSFFSKTRVTCTLTYSNWRHVYNFLMACFRETIRPYKFPVSFTIAWWIGLVQLRNQGNSTEYKVDTRHKAGYDLMRMMFLTIILLQLTVLSGVLAGMFIYAWNWLFNL